MILFVQWITVVKKVTYGHKKNIQHKFVSEYMCVCVFKWKENQSMENFTFIWRKKPQLLAAFSSSRQCYLTLMVLPTFRESVSTEKEVSSFAVVQLRPRAAANSMCCCCTRTSITPHLHSSVTLVGVVVNIRYRTPLFLSEFCRLPLTWKWPWLGLYYVTLWTWYIADAALGERFPVIMLLLLFFFSWLSLTWSQNV